MLQKHKYKTYNEFLALRKHLSGAGNPNVFRLGASEVPNIYRSSGEIGLNEYASPTVFFYECCEYVKRDNPHRLETHRGRVQESIIYSEYWKYRDPNGDDEDYLANYYGPKKVFRKATKCNHIITNDKYPFLFVSPDYMIEKKGGPLEIKSLSRLTTDRYESKIPPKYVVQMYDQIMVTNSSRGELFDVCDATFPRLLTFEKNLEVEQNIIESVNDFVERVLKGKKIVYSRMPDVEKQQALAELAPEDNGHPLYSQFLKDKHKPENAKVTVEGDDEQLTIAVDYLRMKEEAKELEKSILKEENKIREWFQGNIGSIEFKGYGNVNYVEKLSVQKRILENASV